jgi:hypothetical protein
VQYSAVQLTSKAGAGASVLFYYFIILFFIIFCYFLELACRPVRVMLLCVHLLCPVHSDAGAFETFYLLLATAAPRLTFWSTIVREAGAGPANASPLQS